MIEIANISLENELDLIMCHRHSMKLGELSGLSLAAQTSFATAVSEISRNAIDTGNKAQLKLGIEQQANQYTILATISDENKIDSYQHALFLAKRLVNHIDIAQTGNKVNITLAYQAKTSCFSQAQIEEWQKFFRKEMPISPYEEIKKKNELLQKLALKLKEGETYHRQLLQSLPVAVYTCDDKGNLEVYNKAALELWGRIPEQGKNKWCGSYRSYFLDGTPVVDDNCSVALSVQHGKTMEGREKIIERPNGSRRIVKPYPQPIFNSAGKIIGAVNVMIDITDQKRAAKELEESEERLRLATEAAELGTWDYDLMSGRFVSSPRHRQIIGLPEEEQHLEKWDKEKILAFVHPDERKNAEEAFFGAMRSGRLSYEAHIIKPDHSHCWIKVNGTTFFDEKTEKAVRMLGTIHDITEEKSIEINLREAKRASEEALRFKEQFLANMSHEIRTPMNAIVGFTDLILRTDLNQEQKQFIDAIKTSGENLLVIINDILDFSRLQAGGFNFEKIDFKLSQLIGTLTDLMLPKSVEKGIKLSVSINKDIPDTLTGDPTRLNQILLNLVGNAIKFTEVGEVNIRVESIQESDREIELRFTVSDTGIGIPQNKQKSIFEVFMQATNETTRKYGGSGLGLTIVKQLVEQQGGQIHVESEETKGSTFSFQMTYGVNRRPKLETSETPLPIDNTKLEHLRVLLVEDNKLNQVLAKTAMTNWDWDVEIADNGLLAVEKLQENDFDIILMDIQLPEMDGYEATRHIRSHFKGKKRLTPIIAVTAHAMPSEERKCFIAGMNGYISKPFTPKTLYAKIASVMQRNKKTQKNTTS